MAAKATSKKGAMPLTIDCQLKGARGTSPEGRDDSHTRWRVGAGMAQNVICPYSLKSKKIVMIIKCFVSFPPLFMQYAG